MSTKSGASPSRQGFNPYVHGARGLFSVMVFGFHVANSRWAGFDLPGAEAYRYVMIAMQYGVELFFGISGFVIIGALERSPSIALFAWDRFTRIYPVMWVSIAAIVVVALGLHQPLPPLSTILLSIMVVPPFVLTTPVNPPAWSLTWEVTFYTLCAIAFALRRHRAAVAAVVTAGLAMAVAFPRVMLMLPGLLIGTGRMRLPVVVALSRYPATCLVVFLLAWRGLGILAGDGPHQINPINQSIGTWLIFLPGVFFVALMGTSALLGIADGNGWFGRLLAGRVMRWLGTISYSFYLWHPIALHAAKILLGAAVHGIQDKPYGQLALALAGFPIALGVAAASQILIEARLTRWLRQRAGESPREATVTASRAEAIDDNSEQDKQAARASADQPSVAGAA